MTGINNEWAIAQLDDFIAATTVTYVPSPPGSIGFHRSKTAQSEPEIVKKAQIVEQILNRVVPGWRELDVHTDRRKWAVHHKASIRANEAPVLPRTCVRASAPNPPRDLRIEPAPVDLERCGVAVAVGTLPLGGGGRSEEGQRRDTEQCRSARSQRDQAPSGGIYGEGARSGQDPSAQNDSHQQRLLQLCAARGHGAG